MRVCVLGAYDPCYPRNAIIRRGLGGQGWEVIECRCPSDAGLVSASLALIRQFKRRARVADALLVPEFNVRFVPLAAALARTRGIPLVVDFLISSYETTVLDRNLLSPRHPAARARYQMDRLGLRLADRIVVDTEPSVDWFEQLFGGIRAKARVVPVGAPDWKFRPHARPAAASHPLTVLFYGSYLPLHGVEHVLEAARRLADETRFRFVLVGDGQTRDEIEQVYRARPSGNLEFRGSVPPSRLADLVASADVCLGAFGTSGKALRVVPNKVFQCLAVGRPVITGGGEGPRSLLRDGVDCLLVPPGDPPAIADALRRLAADSELYGRLAGQGPELVTEMFGSEPIGRRMAAVLQGAVEGGSA